MYLTNIQEKKLQFIVSLIDRLRKSCYQTMVQVHFIRDENHGRHCTRNSSNVSITCRPPWCHVTVTHLVPIFKMTSIIYLHYLEPRHSVLSAQGSNVEFYCDDSHVTAPRLEVVPCSRGKSICSRCVHCLHPAFRVRVLRSQLFVLSRVFHHDSWPLFARD